MNKRERYDEGNLSRSVLVGPSPEDELYRISLEEEQNNYIEDAIYRKQQKKLSVSAKNYSGAKIVNRKSLANFQSENQSGYSQWLSLCSTHTKTNLQTPLLKTKSARKDSIITELNSMSKKFQESPLKKNEEKFLSMSELCHRYTFINQCTSDKQVFQSNPDLNPMYCYRTELQHPVIRLELRLESFEKNKGGQRMKTRKIIEDGKSSSKFPPIKRQQERDLKDEVQSDLEQQIVKFLFLEKKRGTKEDRKMRNDERLDGENEELNKNGERQRILWRRAKKQMGAVLGNKSLEEGEGIEQKEDTKARKGRPDPSKKRRMERELAKCLSVKKR